GVPLGRRLPLGGERRGESLDLAPQQGDLLRIDLRRRRNRRHGAGGGGGRAGRCDPPDDQSEETERRRRQRNEQAAAPPGPRRGAAQRLLGVEPAVGGGENRVPLQAVFGRRADADREGDPVGDGRPVG